MIKVPRSHKPGLKSVWWMVPLWQWICCRVLWLLWSQIVTAPSLHPDTSKVPAGFRLTVFTWIWMLESKHVFITYVFNAAKMSQCLTNMNILFVRVFPTITHAHSVTMMHLNPHEVCKILMKPVAAVLSLTPASCSNSPSKLNWDLLWVEKLSELHSHTCEGHTENNAKGSSSLWHGVLSLPQSAGTETSRLLFRTSTQV